LIYHINRFFLLQQSNGLRFYIVHRFALSLRVYPKSPRRGAREKEEGDAAAG